MVCYLAVNLLVNTSTVLVVTKVVKWFLFEDLAALQNRNIFYKRTDYSVTLIKLFSISALLKRFYKTVPKVSMSRKTRNHPANKKLKRFLPYKKHSH